MQFDNSAVAIGHRDSSVSDCPNSCILVDSTDLHQADDEEEV